jgi:hypothetical protein
MRNVAVPLILVVVLFASCKKEIAHSTTKKQDSTVSVVTDTTKNNYTLPDTVLTKYNDSYNAWLDFKQKTDNSYVFVMRFDYSEPQFHTIITTKVQNGMVTSRDFLSITYVPDPPNQQAKGDTTAKWHEDGATLGTHPEGGPLMTIDYIYTHAKSDWLNVDPAKNALYFEAKNQGLISECGHFPFGCADNCFTGIQNIASITSL